LSGPPDELLERTIGHKITAERLLSIPTRSDRDEINLLKSPKEVMSYSVLAEYYHESKQNNLT